ncbi:MAG: hypothetical protein HKK66_03360 [Chlorobiaceae bacterium]|nr:hypothetical protein [Chlorobiaceae bacterium]
MKLQPRLKGSVKGLIDELMVSFPVDLYDAQRMLASALQSPAVIRLVRSSIELEQMEEGIAIEWDNHFNQEAL